MLEVIKQYEYESESWKRVLGFFQEECINFKKRLSEILKHEVSSDLLERAEYFQYKFITHDELIRLLYNDIVNQCKLLQKEILVDGERLDHLVKVQHKLRYEIKIEEKEFSKLREEFNGYLIENFLQMY